MTMLTDAAKSLAGQHWMMNVMKLQVPTTMFDFVDFVIGTAAGTVSQTVVEVN